MSITAEQARTKSEKLARAMDGILSGRMPFNRQIAAQVRNELRAQAAEIERLTHERDDAIAQADARVAAAYEDAANELQRVVDNWDCGHMESRLCDCAAYVEQWDLAANTIREITMPAGARAALDLLTVQARAQGMREAAEIVSEHEEVELLSTLVRVLQKRSAGNRAGITFAEAILSRADEIEKGEAR